MRAATSGAAITTRTASAIGSPAADSSDHVHGETDEWGHKSVKDVVNHYDWHATLLHCFGLDHTKLIYKRNGTAASLTDGQGAHVVKELIA